MGRRLPVESEVLVVIRVVSHWGEDLKSSGRERPCGFDSHRRYWIREISRGVRSPIGIGEGRSVVRVALLLPPVKTDSDGESQNGATGGSASSRSR